MNFSLDECQKKAIVSAFTNKITIIVGPAGSGKSTICKYIYEIAKRKNMSIKMMSPTGKAAQVLSNKTGHGASTIHRGLRMLPGDSSPREDITEDILLVDEIGMCGIDTIYAMFQSMEGNLWGNMVFVGDKNQLPSVSPGNFLFDFMDTGIVNVVELDTIHRQSEDSYISVVSNEIAKGKVTPIPDNSKDITWHDLKYNTFYDDLIEFINGYVDGGSNIDDLQIISPMKKGHYGVFKINELIQEEMAKRNNSCDDFMQRQFNKFYVGDRVIQIENNYEKMIFNGDMGKIIEMGEKIVDPSKSDKKEKFITVSFYGEEVTFYGEEIDQINLAWCITVHKFQGSQSNNIVFIMANEAQIMMYKELVYTAFTRAAEKLDVFGDISMFRLAPTKSSINKRYTNFSQIIKSLKTDKHILKVL